MLPTPAEGAEPQKNKLQRTKEGSGGLDKAAQEKRLRRSAGIPRKPQTQRLPPRPGSPERGPPKGTIAALKNNKQQPRVVFRREPCCGGAQANVRVRMLQETYIRRTRRTQEPIPRTKSAGRQIVLRNTGIEPVTSRASPIRGQFKGIPRPHYIALEGRNEITCVRLARRTQQTLGPPRRMVGRGGA